MKLGCILMAAGSSSRFGSNKLLAQFRGKPLYRWALEAVPAEVFDRVHVVTGCREIAEAAGAMGFAPICNDRPELGVSRTIALGLAGLEDCGGVMFLTADQPCLRAETVRQVAERFRQSPACIWAAGCGGRKGNPCLFPRTLYPELLALTGDHGGSRVIKAHADLLQLVETPAEELCDCDTVQALESLEKGQKKTQTE